MAAVLASAVAGLACIAGWYLIVKANRQDLDVLDDYLLSRSHEAFETNTDELIAARRDLDSGRVDDAKYRLDRILSDIDSAWRCRA
jgi:hypothetical protein